MEDIVFRKKEKVEPMHIDPGLYPTIVDTVLSMNGKVKKRLSAQK